MLRKAFFPLLALLTLLPWNLGVAQTTAPPAERAVRSRMEAVTAAWGTMDAAKILPFYSTDPDGVFFDLSPLEYRGAATFIPSSLRGLSDDQSISLIIRGDARIHLMTPDSAWTTATVDLGQVHKDGKKETMPIRWTSVWSKTNGQWIIVHDHWSAPMP